MMPVARVTALMCRRLHTPFAWGTADCVVWAFDAAQVQTGHDALADLRGAYDTAPQAARLLRALGGLRAAAAARLGPAVPLNEVQRGHIVLLDGTRCGGATCGQGGLAVAWGDHAVAQGALGLVCVDLRHATHAWRPA